MPVTATDLGLDPGPLRLLAIRLAQAAGELVLSERRRQVPAADTKSTPTDPVTAVDRASERLIRQLLQHERPDDAVMGEEAAATTGSSGLTWVIDPIDGTVNFLYGLPAYAVSVAVADADQVLAGAVHNPVSGETWAAARGRGAWLDGRPIRVSRPVDLARSLVATGFSYRAEQRRAQAVTLTGLIPHVRDVRRMGAAALDLCNVACGRVDAYYEQGLKPWDCAAGLLIAHEAGAVIRSRWNTRDPAHVCFAAAPTIAAELAPLVGVDAAELVGPSARPGGVDDVR